MSLIGDVRAALPEGVNARELGEDVINIYPSGRDVHPDDVAALRGVLAAHGATEVESWIATEGMSWLSDGITSVSLRIRRSA